jgi:hypothetical protein
MAREKAIEYINKQLDAVCDDALQYCANILSSEPCENAVSRDKVLNELNRIGRNAFKDDTDYDSLFAFVEELPPVTPKIPYPPYCGEDCRCGEGDDGEGCPYLNQNEECIIELLNR